MCGAVSSSYSCAVNSMGSSPRVRSGRLHRPWNRVAGGIISACAERSNALNEVQRIIKDHLRVCGAVYTDQLTISSRHGSSPRVRSGHRRETPRRGADGIISACAERSSTPCCQGCPTPDHLRVCGAVCSRWSSPAPWYGSSPRVRSGPTERVG